MFQKLSGIKKISRSERNIIIFRRKFFVPQDQNISWRISFVLRGVFAIRKFSEDEGGRGERLRVPVGNLLSHITENFRKRTIRHFRIFGYEKTSFISGVYHNFLSNFFCLRVPKIFVVQPFCVSVKFWYREMLQLGEVSRLPVKSFLSYRTKKIVGGFFCIPEN